MRKGFVITGIVMWVIAALVFLVPATTGVAGVVAGGILFIFIGGPLILIGLILIIVGAVTSTYKEKSRVAAVQGGAYNQALNDLNDQLLKGQITEKEYKQKKKLLLK